MQNLMLIDNNVSNIQKIANSISLFTNDLILYNISLSIKESIDIINKKEVDIILINIDTFGIEILNYILNKNYNRYQQSIILIYKNYNDLKNVPVYLYKKYLYKCITITETISNLGFELNSLALFKEKHSTQNNIRNKVIKELSKIHYNLNSVGTKHIVDGILLIKKNKKYKINLTQDIYIPLSQKYHTSINTIKGAITQSTINMYFDCDETTLKKYFGYLDDVSKPTIKEIITTICDKI